MPLHAIATATKPKVLNVGGGSRDLPEMFNGWEQTLLDINPHVSPDIVMDSTNIRYAESQKAKYDAVYCSHSLEHVYHYRVAEVIEGFHHALVPGGFVYLAVPDIGGLIKAMQGRDIHDVWYQTGAGIPITFHDVLYGWGLQIAQGNEHFAHKTGFTAQSLDAALAPYFKVRHVAADGHSNLTALAIKVVL